jgi:hypothetical protein
MIGGDLMDQAGGEEHEHQPEDLRQLSVEDFRSGGVAEGDDGAAGFESSGVSGDAGGSGSPSSLRDFISQTLGYQGFGQDVADDSAVLAHLVREAQRADALEAQARQQDIYTQLGRQLAPQADRLQSFLAQPAAPVRKAWEPPPFDPRWAALVEPVGDGLYVGRPGAPQEIVDQVNRFAEWSTSYHSNPAAVLQPMIEDVRQQVLEDVRGEIRQLREQQQFQGRIAQIVQSNAAWAYARDAAGSPIPDPVHGGYALSPLGQQYLGLVRGLGERGVRDPIHRDEIARQMLQPQLAALAGQGSTAPTRTPTAKGQRAHELLKRAHDAAAGQVNHRTSSRPGSLGEMLALAFEAEGVDDRTFRRMSPDGQYPAN